MAAPSPAAPLALSRARVSYEPDRDFVVGWSRDGGLDQVWTIGGKAAPTRALSATEDWYDQGYHGCATLPEGLAAGKYAVGGGGGRVSEVEVVRPPARRVSPFVQPNEDSRANVLKHLKAGYLVIRLAAGLHVWDEIVTLPAWCVVQGYGATVTHGYRVAYGGNWPLILVGGDDVSVYGVTFVHDRNPAFQVFVSLTDPYPAGLVCGDCTFKRCNFGFYLRDVYVRDCRFESAGAVIAPTGLWLRCAFTGPPLLHAFSHWPGQGRLAMFDSTFAGTDRGPMFRTGGEMSGFLFVGTRCHGIRCTVPNGGEIFSFEGPGPFSNHLFLHTRVWGCDSSVFQWGGNGDGTARNSLIRDLSVDGGLGVLWWGQDVSDNEVREFELRGCGWYCGSGARRNRMVNGSAVGFLPTRGNQNFKNPAWPHDKRRVVLWDEGQGNNIQNVDVIGTPAGMTDVVGFGAVK